MKKIQLNRKNISSHTHACKEEELEIQKSTLEKTTYSKEKLNSTTSITRNYKQPKSKRQNIMNYSL